MTKEHWLQRLKKQTSAEEQKAALKGIRKHAEKAQRDYEARQEKLNRRYGD